MSGEPPKAITNKIGMKLVLIPAGEFLMGSPNNDAFAEDDEGPQHRVRISDPFYVAATDVTVGQFRQVVGKSGRLTEAQKIGAGGDGWNQAKAAFKRDSSYNWLNPGYPQGDDHPVVLVSWNDVIDSCNRLSRIEGRNGAGTGMAIDSIVGRPMPIHSVPPSSTYG